MKVADKLAPLSMLKQHLKEIDERVASLTGDLEALETAFPEISEARTEGTLGKQPINVANLCAALTRLASASTQDEILRIFTQEASTFLPQGLLFRSEEGDFKLHSSYGHHELPIPDVEENIPDCVKESARDLVIICLEGESLVPSTVADETAPRAKSAISVPFVVNGACPLVLYGESPEVIPTDELELLVKLTTLILQNHYLAHMAQVSDSAIVSAVSGELGEAGEESALTPEAPEAAEEGLTEPFLSSTEASESSGSDDAEPEPTEDARSTEGEAAYELPQDFGWEIVDEEEAEVSKTELDTEERWQFGDEEFSIGDLSKGDFGLRDLILEEEDQAVESALESAADTEYDFSQTDLEQDSAEKTADGSVAPGEADFDDLNKPTPEEEALHAEAHRFARLLVAEIKLYNEEAVAAARERSALYEQLKGDIERSRDMYMRRVHPTVRSRTDYLDLELIRVLAQGNVDLMGSAYPGPQLSDLDVDAEQS